MWHLLMSYNRNHKLSISRIIVNGEILYSNSHEFGFNVSIMLDKTKYVGLEKVKSSLYVQPNEKGSDCILIYMKSGFMTHYPILVNVWEYLGTPCIIDYSEIITVITV